MNVRHFSLAVSVVATLMLPGYAAAAAWKHPKTPWGDPDLRGTWPVVHLISVPLERPPQYGERLNFTEEEMAEQRKRVEARNKRYQEEDAAGSHRPGPLGRSDRAAAADFAHRRSAEWPSASAH